MAVNDAVRPADRSLLDLPRFDLCFGVDDVEAPATVTVYSESVDEIDTHWISIEADWAIDVADVA